MRRRSVFLVCQHLETISRDALEKYQDVVREYVRNRHGIYALYHGNKLYYVGLATDLRTRLGQHLKNRHGKLWDRFSVYLTIGDGHIRELEALVLRITKPKGNKQIGKLTRSENLIRRLRKDLRAQQRRELSLLTGWETLVSAVQPRVSISSNGRKAILAQYITRPMKLRVRFKGKLLRAKVRKNGTIRFNGKTFSSPSLAAGAACRRRTCNGWTFWSFERAPGDWVLLNELRQ